MSSIALEPGGRVERPKASRSVKALSAVNFFLADVRDGLGPFLGVFLIGQGWGTDTIGYVLTIGGLAGMLATTPLGILADVSRAKRFIVAFCAVLVIVASLVILFLPSVPLVAASQIATGVAGAAIGPAIASLTLGIVGQKGLAHQLGRNEAWNHGGNVFAAAGAGFFAYEYGLTAVFVLMTVMAAFSILAVLMIRPGDIDHDAARGLERKADERREEPSSFAILFRSAPLLILAATLLLFHFGNGALLPLLGQQVAAAGIADTGEASFLMNPAVYTSMTIIIAQLTMIPMALLAASIAGKRGYYLLLVAALVAMPVRALIAGLWVHPYAVLPIQMLDGVGAGLLGVAVPGLVARILRGTGHVNAGLGAVMTVQGIGASLSPSLAGYVAATWGFSAAYLVLGAIAAMGLVLWLVSAARVSKACAPDGGTA
ncbi:MFS transporter [Aureimonas sp. SA4125]|uniref:MFS transporter n=1 Tax=Aureimonas sp. SA4125 TaxID=2826993 RepID=UPI001CC47EAC|nr:MFS transporter [Aureimonas sp. SA4125]BDA87061.1 MFS transporter [Aureimonas sp. SA4125]